MDVCHSQLVQEQDVHGCVIIVQVSLVPTIITLQIMCVFIKQVDALEIRSQENNTPAVKSMEPRFP